MLFKAWLRGPESKFERVRHGPSRVFLGYWATNGPCNPWKGLHRIEHVLQAAFTSLELQSAHCPLNFDLFTLKQSCSICDQMTRMIHFKPLKIKTACKTLNKYRCCEPIKMVRWNISNQKTHFNESVIMTQNFFVQYLIQFFINQFVYV